MRTIAVLNQKGGVGKTTTVANLGSALAQRGQSVCLVDLDPQANLTMHFGIDPATVRVSTYDVLTQGTPISRGAVMVEPNVTILPAVIDLAAAEVELAAEVGREQILHGRMEADDLSYDLMLIDCPPSLGLLTLNALAAVDEVLIPLQPHFLALQGLGRLLETVDLVQKRINPRLKVSGVVFCMFESATKLANEVVEDVSTFFQSARGGHTPWSDARVFNTRIRRNIKLAECPSYGTTILHYEPSSNGAKDYRDLAEEFLFPPQQPAAATATVTKPTAATEPAAASDTPATAAAEPAPVADVIAPELAPASDAPATAAAESAPVADGNLPACEAASEPGPATA